MILRLTKNSETYNLIRTLQQTQLRSERCMETKKIMLYDNADELIANYILENEIVDGYVKAGYATYEFYTESGEVGHTIKEKLFENNFPE
jgi:hypothetical protein